MNNQHTTQLTNIFRSKDRSEGKKRTQAIRDSFIDALNDLQFSIYRPDEIWTSLQNVYNSVQCGPYVSQIQSGNFIVSEITQGIKSVSQGWAKSSGTAFEYFITDHYDPLLKNCNPQMRCLLKANKTEINSLSPTNLGVQDLGTHKIDDLYLLVKTGSSWIIFGMISAQASGGDRWERATNRCATLRNLGLTCLNITLDPRDVSRSPNGNLNQPDYLIRFQAQNPSYNAHFVIDDVDNSIFVPNEIITPDGTAHALDLPSRLFRTNIRSNRDSFLIKAELVARQFILGGHSLNAVHRW